MKSHSDDSGRIAALEAEIARLTAERDRFEAALGRACLVGGTTYLLDRAEKAEVERDAAQADAEAWARKCAAADEMRDAALLAALQPDPDARQADLAKTWQPIETAPKDGTRVMLWRGFISHGEWSEMIIAEWHDGEWLWPDPRENPSTHGEWTDYDLIDGYGDASGPTHWMPLPTPPADLAAKIGGE